MDVGSYEAIFSEQEHELLSNLASIDTDLLMDDIINFFMACRNAHISPVLIASSDLQSHYCSTVEHGKVFCLTVSGSIRDGYSELSLLNSSLDINVIFFGNISDSLLNENPGIYLATQWIYCERIDDKPQLCITGMVCVALQQKKERKYTNPNAVKGKIVEVSSILSLPADNDFLKHSLVCHLDSSSDLVPLSVMEGKSVKSSIILKNIRQNIKHVVRGTIHSKSKLIKHQNSEENEDNHKHTIMVLISGHQAKTLAPRLHPGMIVLLKGCQGHQIGSKMCLVINDDAHFIILRDDRPELPIINKVNEERIVFSRFNTPKLKNFCTSNSTFHSAIVNLSATTIVGSMTGSAFAVSSNASPRVRSIILSEWGFSQSSLGSLFVPTSIFDANGIHLVPSPPTGWKSIICNRRNCLQRDFDAYACLASHVSVRSSGGVPSKVYAGICSSKTEYVPPPPPGIITASLARQSREILGEDVSGKLKKSIREIGPLHERKLLKAIPPLCISHQSAIHHLMALFSPSLLTLFAESKIQSKLKENSQHLLDFFINIVNGRLCRFVTARETLLSSSEILTSHDACTMACNPNSIDAQTTHLLAETANACRLVGLCVASRIAEEHVASSSSANSCLKHPSRLCNSLIVSRLISQFAKKHLCGQLAACCMRELVLRVMRGELIKNKQQQVNVCLSDGGMCKDNLISENPNTTSASISRLHDVRSVEWPPSSLMWIGMQPRRIINNNNTASSDAPVIALSTQNPFFFSDFRASQLVDGDEDFFLGSTQIPLQLLSSDCASDSNSNSTSELLISSDESDLEVTANFPIAAATYSQLSLNNIAAAQWELEGDEDSNISGSFSQRETVRAHYMGDKNNNIINEDSRISKDISSSNNLLRSSNGFSKFRRLTSFDELVEEESASTEDDNNNNNNSNTDKQIEAANEEMEFLNKTYETLIKSHKNKFRTEKMARRLSRISKKIKAMSQVPEGQQDARQIMKSNMPNFMSSYTASLRTMILVANVKGLSGILSHIAPTDASNFEGCRIRPLWRVKGMRTIADGTSAFLFIDPSLSSANSRRLPFLSSANCGDQPSPASAIQLPLTSTFVIDSCPTITTHSGNVSAEVHMIMSRLSNPKISQLCPSLWSSNPVPSDPAALHCGRHDSVVVLLVACCNAMQEDDFDLVADRSAPSIKWIATFVQEVGSYHENLMGDLLFEVESSSYSSQISSPSRFFELFISYESSAKMQLFDVCRLVPHPSYPVVKQWHLCNCSKPYSNLLSASLGLVECFSSCFIPYDLKSLYQLSSGSVPVTIRDPFELQNYIQSQKKSVPQSKTKIMPSLPPDVSSVTLFNLRGWTVANIWTPSHFQFQSSSQTSSTVSLPSRAALFSVIRLFPPIHDQSTPQCFSQQSTASMCDADGFIPWIDLIAPVDDPTSGWSLLRPGAVVSVSHALACYVSISPQSPYSYAAHPLYPLHPMSLLPCEAPFPSWASKLRRDTNAWRLSRDLTLLEIDSLLSPKIGSPSYPLRTFVDILRTSLSIHFMQSPVVSMFSVAPRTLPLSPSVLGDGFALPSLTPMVLTNRSSANPPVVYRVASLESLRVSFCCPCGLEASKAQFCPCCGYRISSPPSIPVAQRLVNNSHSEKDQKQDAVNRISHSWQSFAALKVELLVEVENPLCLSSSICLLENQAAIELLAIHESFNNSSLWPVEWRMENQQENKVRKNAVVNLNSQPDSWASVFSNHEMDVSNIISDKDTDFLRKCHFIASMLRRSLLGNTDGRTAIQADRLMEIKVSSSKKDSTTLAIESPFVRELASHLWQGTLEKKWIKMWKIDREGWIQGWQPTQMLGTDVLNFLDEV